MTCPPPRAPVAVFLFVLLLGGCSAAQPPGFGPLPIDADYAIYDAGAERLISLEEAADRLVPADVIFFGEFHDDPRTHAVQRDLLEEIGQRRERLILGLEMFERDVQGVLDAYLAGEIDEEAFLARSRPWGNYSDYRPLVELAREQGWPVLATNLPQALATAIARGGIQALNGLPSEQRAQAAGENQCPDDTYWTRFVEAITESADSSGHAAFSDQDPMLRRMFEAQCGRDEAMAETLAAAADPSTLIFHVTGAFHSDYGQGTVERLLRRSPDLDVRVVSAIPVENMGEIDLNEHLARADYLIFTRAP